MTELVKLNHRHEAIALWLIGNPDKSQGDCAKELEYTESWLSRVINSDMFQAHYQELCTELKVVAVHSIGNKLNHAANLALDKTIAKLDQPIVTERFLTDARKDLLSSLGYTGSAQPAGEVHFHKHEYLTEEDVRGAAERARIENSKEIEITPITEEASNGA